MPNQTQEQVETLRIRDDRIRALRADDWTMHDLGELFGLTVQRIAQIVGRGTGYLSSARNLNHGHGI